MVIRINKLWICLVKWNKVRLSSGLVPISLDCSAAVYNADLQVEAYFLLVRSFLVQDLCNMAIVFPSLLYCPSGDMVFKVH